MIWELLERATNRDAHAPAVVDVELVWSYAELYARAVDLALFWRERGIRRGDRVAILDANSAPYIAAYFAAAGAGAVLQPLNSRLAARELAETLADSGAGLLWADGSFRPTVEACLESLAVPGTRSASTGLAVEYYAARGSQVSESRREGPAGFAPERVGPDDLAQLYYTSGTTGRPKGVMLTHANVCAHAEAAVQELQLKASDRWGHFAPLFHLADAWASFAITSVGGRHVILRRFAPQEAWETLERDGVTLTNLVPTMLLDMVEHEGAERFDASSLRTMLSGGAPISPSLVKRVLRTFGCEYVQTYGMTETSPYLTLGILHEHLRGLPEEERLRYVARTGRPFAAVELQVVDAADVEVPADDLTVGEIRVRGKTVSPGYWRRPEETAAVFRGGWLYTGDLAVVDAEGFVDIVDRKKDMILTGGENVYSTEVENVLYEHTSVLECAVFGEPDARWGEAVCAAVVLKPGARVSTEELRAFCRARIAGYKVPRKIDLRSVLPRTGSGKISKHRLREDGAC